MPIREKLPLFSPDTFNECFIDILFPSHLHILGRLISTSSLIDWSEKEDKVVWRGSATGGDFTTTNSNFEVFHRHKCI